MAKTYDILQANQIFPTTVVNRYVFTSWWDSERGGSDKWRIPGGIKQPYNAFDAYFGQESLTTDRANEIREFISTPDNAICRINNLSVYAYLRNNIKIIMWHGEIRASLGPERTIIGSVKFHEINPPGVLWSTPLPQGPQNALSSPITRPQENTKFNIFSKEDPFYLLSGNSLFVGLEGPSDRNETFELSVVCSYELLTFNL